MRRSIGRIPELMLGNIIAELERDINAIKEFQTIGRNNTKVIVTKTNNAINNKLIGLN